MNGKILEDIYCNLKGKWWGKAIIIIALAFIIVLAIWNSLPDSTKEQVLNSNENSSPNKDESINQQHETSEYNIQNEREKNENKYTSSPPASIISSTPAIEMEISSLNSLLKKLNSPSWRDRLIAINDLDRKLSGELTDKTRKTILTELKKRYKIEINYDARNELFQVLIKYIDEQEIKQ